MTKKDYELIAGVIREQCIEHNGSLSVPYESDEYYARYEGKIDALEYLVDNLARKLSADNPRFDAKIFRKACIGGQ